jgi:putative addiction module component (TIGR02574 family)
MSCDASAVPIDGLDTDDANAEQAWRAEMHRRLQEIDSGTVTLIPWRDARCRLRARLQR